MPNPRIIRTEDGGVFLAITDDGSYLYDFDRGPATTRRKTKLQQEVADLEDKVEELERKAQDLKQEEEVLAKKVKIKQTVLDQMNDTLVRLQSEKQLYKEEIVQLSLLRKGLLIESGLPEEDEVETTPPEPVKRGRAAKAERPPKGRRAKAIPFVDSPYIVDLDTSKK